MCLSYPRDPLKLKPTSLVMCLWFPRSSALSTSNRPTPYAGFYQFLRVEKCQLAVQNVRRHSCLCYHIVIHFFLDNCYILIFQFTSVYTIISVFLNVSVISVCSGSLKMTLCLTNHGTSTAHLWLIFSWHWRFFPILMI